MSAQETIKQLEDLIEKKIPLSPSGWLDIIGRLVVEMSEETDKLYAFQKEVAELRVDCIREGMSVAEAKIRIEATQAYEAMQKQKAHCLKIEELIRIGKLQSKLRDTEYGAGNL